MNIYYIDDNKYLIFRKRGIFMETNYSNGRQLFKTGCKVMSYNEYLNSKNLIPFVDIGHFEGDEYKSDIKIWLNESVTMEANGEFKVYRWFNCNDFASFIVSIIYQIRYIKSNYLLDEFTYSCFASSIKCLFEVAVPDDIISWRNHSFTEETNIPIINGKKDLDLLSDMVNIPCNCEIPLVKYTSPNNSIFYIIRDGNIVVDNTYNVQFDEFEKIIKMTSLIQGVVNDLYHIDAEHSQYLDDLINLISEK
nr:MAG TPA: hypothetical protein [Caudoviricetes sp.]